MEVLLVKIIFWAAFVIMTVIAFTPKASAQVGGVINFGGASADSSAAIFVPNSPTSIFPNRREYVRFTKKDTITFRYSNIKFDSIFKKLSTADPTNLVGIRSSDSLMIPYDKDGITFNQDQIIGLQDSLNSIHSGMGDVYTKSQSDGRYVHYTDTASMLDSYLRKVDTASMLGPYLRTVLLAGTLSPYLTSATAAATYQPIGSYATTGQLAAKLNISDTAAMLMPYVHKNDTFPTGMVMTTSAANSAIADINTNINGKVPQARTLTLVAGSGINVSPTGAQDLSANRSWTITATGGTGTVTSVGLTSTDFAISGSPVTTSGNITANLNTSGVSAGSYDRVTVNNKGIVTAGANPVMDTLSASRSFNFAYQMSASAYTDIAVSASIACNLSLTSGQSGEIILEVSPNGSTGWVQRGTIAGSNTGTLTIGLNTTQITGGQLFAKIPPGHYWRLTTNNVTGSPTYTMRIGNKTTY